MATQRLIPGGPGIEETATAQRLIPGGPGIGEAFTSTQTLTPSLVTNTQTFYGPTISPGAVSIAPSLVTNTQVFYSPTVTPGAVLLAPELVSNEQVFYGPTVSGQVPAVETPSGGWKFPEHKRKTKEEIEQERIELGIIPAPVAKAVEKAAKRVIAKAKQQDASPEPPDPLKWLQAHHEQQSANLAADLRKKRIEASLDDRRTYMILLRLEIEAQLILRAEQDREDEQIVMLLMEM